jgi:hypothetical protein
MGPIHFLPTAKTTPNVLIGGIVLGRLTLSLLVLITVSVIILAVVLQLQVVHKTWPAKPIL